jgi:prepilin-type processing-associated H-X9-DG protein
MKRNSAFTLVELLVAIATMSFVIATALSILIRVREKRLQTACKANISSIGKGLAIYTAASRDQWPWMEGNRTWDVPTGAGRIEPIEPTLRAQEAATGGVWPSNPWPPVVVEGTDFNVSALLFMLVRDGQTPEAFVCPATTDTPDPNTLILNSYPWDFSPYADGNAEHVSYSYQAPIRDLKGLWTREGSWTSGVTPRAKAGLIALADRTPTYAGLSADFDWRSPGKADPRIGMSQNHARGEMINLLFADFHVGDSAGRADVGINNDNVYSAAGLGSDGNALGTSQGPGTLNLSDHRSPDDSFLLGPKRMERR